MKQRAPLNKGHLLFGLALAGALAVLSVIWSQRDNLCWRDNFINGDLLVSFKPYATEENKNNALKLLGQKDCGTGDSGSGSKGFCVLHDYDKCSVGAVRGLPYVQSVSIVAGVTAAVPQ